MDWFSSFNRKKDKIKIFMKQLLIKFIEIDDKKYLMKDEMIENEKVTESNRNSDGELEDEGMMGLNLKPEVAWILRFICD